MSVIIDSPLNRVLELLPDHRKSGNGFEAKCPAHEDSRASLSISEGDDGRVLVTCHAGCSFKEIASALRLKPSEFFPPKTGRTSTKSQAKPKKKKAHKSIEDATRGYLAWKKATFARQWKYQNSDGSYAFTVVRGDLADGTKEIFPVHKTDEGWYVGLPPKDRHPQGLPLYRVNDIPPEDRVFVVEGEKCADALWSVGFAAVTSQGGCKAFDKSDFSSLTDRDVVLLPDRDEPGEQYIAGVARELQKFGVKSLRIARLDSPDGETPEGFDVADYIESLDSKNDEDIVASLNALFASSPEWTPQDDDAGCPDDKGDVGSTDADELCTELRNAEEVARRHRHEFRFHTDQGKYYIYSGRCWEVDAALRVDQAIKTVAREAWDLVKDADPKVRARHAVKMESSAGVSGVRKLLQSEPGIAVAGDCFDQNDYLLNCTNGTVDLRTGNLQSHNPADLITKTANSVFDPNAECPRWLTFLNRVMDGSEALIGYLQRIAGLSLSGLSNVHEFWIFHGSGGNGKSVFLDTLTGLLGDGYAGVAPDSLFTVRQHVEHQTEIADLWGKRLVVGSETERGAQLRMQLIKRLTGDQYLKARFMRQDFFMFRRTHKMILATNNRPTICESTAAVWRRIRLIPFTVSIPEREMDINLIEKLKAEWPGVLAWAVRGFQEWQRVGMNPPKEVLAATDDYKETGDHFDDFARERLIFGEGDVFRITRFNLFTEYSAWCKAKSISENDRFDRSSLYDRTERVDGVTRDEWKEGGNKVRGFRGVGICYGGAS